MWRSFGQGTGGPMGGGGGGGGGGMMKTVHKAVRATTGGRGSIEEPFYRSTTTHNSSTTTSPTSRPSYKPSSSDYNSNTLSFSTVNHPNLAHSTLPIGEEYDDYVFCSVPSMDEVHDAVSSLQQVVDPPTRSHDSELEFDWIEPSRSMLQSHGSKSVHDAFHLLQTEPSVKKMVISLSSDKSVWDAVMNNEAVRELRDSVYEANKSISEKVESCDGSFPVSDILNWIFINTKAKGMEIFEKITDMVNKLFFHSPKNKEESEATEPFEKNLRSSFFLSIMVLLIVVVSRANKS